MPILFFEKNVNSFIDGIPHLPYFVVAYTVFSTESMTYSGSLNVKFSTTTSRAVKNVWVPPRRGQHPADFREQNKIVRIHKYVIRTPRYHGMDEIISAQIRSKQFVQTQQIIICTAVRRKSFRTRAKSGSTRNGVIDDRLRRAARYAMRWRNNRVHVDCFLTHRWPLGSPHVQSVRAYTTEPHGAVRTTPNPTNPFDPSEQIDHHCPTPRHRRRRRVVSSENKLVQTISRSNAQHGPNRQFIGVALG